MTTPILSAIGGWDTVRFETAFKKQIRLRLLIEKLEHEIVHSRAEKLDHREVYESSDNDWLGLKRHFCHAVARQRMFSQFAFGLPLKCAPHKCDELFTELISQYRF